MTDPNSSGNAPTGNSIQNQISGAYGPPKIIYVAYLIGLVFPLAALGGLVYAYLSRGKDKDVDTHLTFQIRMFWWGLLAGILGSITVFIVIGWFILLAWVVWVLARCITGLQLASQDKPVSDPTTLSLKAT